MEAHLVVLVTVLGLTRAIPPLLDLSFTYNLDPPASNRVKILEKGMNRVYIGVELNQICSSEHAGTHLEAPITFESYGMSVDEIPFESLWRVPGVMMDVSRFVYRDFELTADMLQAWQNESSLIIPDGAILIIHTGWVPRGKLSIDDDGDDTLPPQPRLSKDAAVWVAEYVLRHSQTKGIIGVGIDLKSLDENDANRTTSARARLYENNIYALHNLHDTDKLPQSGFLVTVMPMKIHEGGAAPARIMAEREDTRPKPDEDDDGDDDDRHGEWGSERDYKYPYPRWGYEGKGGVMMITSGKENKCASGMDCLVMSLIPLMMALRW